MIKVISVRLEWEYFPKTYLEEPISIEFEGGVLEIKDGVALTDVDPDIFLADQSMREELTKKIESRLQAVQIMTHKDFKLSKPSRTDLQEDGKKHQFLDVVSCVTITSVGSIDLIVKK